MLIQLPETERERIEALAHERGYESAADYVLALIEEDQLAGVITSDNIPQELRDILETTPPEEVIAKIEALNPPWKKDLLPWRVVQPGQTIPWQAVYVLFDVPLTEADHDWAYSKILKLGLLEDGTVKGVTQELIDYAKMRARRHQERTRQTKSV